MECLSLKMVSILPLKWLKIVFLILWIFSENMISLLVQNIIHYTVFSLKSTVRCQRLWVVWKCANLTCMWFPWQSLDNHMKSPAAEASCSQMGSVLLRKNWKSKVNLLSRFRIWIDSWEKVCAVSAKIIPEEKCDTNWGSWKCAQ